MTNGELASIEKRLLALFSSQINEMRETFVTNEEFKPVAEMVKRHEKPFAWFEKYKTRLAWIGLASIWVSPHATAIGKLLGNLFLKLVEALGSK